jgi:hypothetical protein
VSFPFVLGADSLGGGALLDVEESEESAPSTSSSWDSLGTVVAGARAAAEAARESERQACPYCGEPLRRGGPRGVLFCPFDGYQPR